MKDLREQRRGVHLVFYAGSTAQPTIRQLQISITRYRYQNAPRAGLLRYVASQLHTCFGAVATCAGSGSGIGAIARRKQLRLAQHPLPWRIVGGHLRLADGDDVIPHQCRPQGREMRVDVAI